MCWILVLSAVCCYVISCITLVLFTRTELGWHHLKEFNYYLLYFVKLGDADGTIQKYMPLLVPDWIIS